MSGDVRCRISRRDILTWESEPFPAYLIVFGAKQAKAYSIYLQRYFARAGISSVTITRASVEVRWPNQEVNVQTMEGWRSDKKAVLTKSERLRMSKSVTFQQLQKTLSEFGFISQQNGSHAIFRHPKTGTALTVPNLEGAVRPVYVSNAARQLANSGIATTSTFAVRLEKAAREAD